MLVVILLTALLIPANTWFASRRSPPDWGPVVGSDLHAVAVFGGRTLVGGHSASGLSDRAGSWATISTLDQVHVTAWARTAAKTLAAGEEGLHVSFDNGSTCSVWRPFTGTKVEALGAARDTVYAATQEGGLLISTDAGRSFQPRNGRVGLTGVISPDPRDPDRAVAVDEGRGAVITVGGGKRWRRLSPQPAVAAASLNPAKPDEIAVLGPAGLSVSRDSGRSWESVESPEGLLALAPDSRGALVAAALVDDRAVIFRKTDGAWQVVV